jgi:hypothetical protein
MMYFFPFGVYCRGEALLSRPSFRSSFGHGSFGISWTSMDFTRTIVSCMVHILLVVVVVVLFINNLSEASGV